MAKKQPRHPGDPRIDLVSDHRHWKTLLWNCWHEERDIYYLLHGLRCGGAEIILTNKSYRLMPGEWAEEKWEDIKQKHLAPCREELVEVLRTARVMKLTPDEKVPEEWR